MVFLRSLVLYLILEIFESITFAKVAVDSIVNKLLSKPISSSKVKGASGEQNRSVLDVDEDSSAEATYKLAEEIELQKKSIGVDEKQNGITTNQVSPHKKVIPNNNSKAQETEFSESAGLNREKIQGSSTNGYNQLKNPSAKPVDINVNKQQKLPEKKKEFGIVIKKSPPISGIYCGLYLSGMAVFPEAESWTIGYSPKGGLTEKGTVYVLNTNEFCQRNAMHYGSYAYNRNTWLADFSAFLGYNLFLISKLRLGFEIQGSIGWRNSEISSSGVFAEIDPNRREELGETFKDLDNDHGTPSRENPVPDEAFHTVAESDFAYSRQTINVPHNFLFKPSLGWALSDSAIIYTILGLKYGLWEIKDHPENIEVITTYDVKPGIDTIYSQYNFALVGGLGIETALNKNFFLRAECLYSKSPEINIEKDVLQPTGKEDENRQLENLGIKTIRNISFGLGAGWRF
ncbi:MAG: hypothetical protein LBS83_02710 [Holosporales bacterium]|jgi:opacity protein-like surface antigen|nr:hypothetical protein [Holosporales bacterium]